LTLCAPVTAQAATHTFSDSSYVTVGLKLRAGAAPGTVLVFSRNQVTLAVGTTPRLELRAPGLPTQALPIATSQAVTVNVTLSSTSHMARVTVAGRSARLNAAFTNENAVDVPSGSPAYNLDIRHVNAAPAPAPAATPAPTPSPTPTPTPAPAPASGNQLFASDSFWNAPLPANAALDLSDATLSGELRDQAQAEIADRTGPWIDTTSYSTPLYRVPAGQPAVAVKLDKGSWATGLQAALAAVPIPANAAPAAGTDGHMTIWQPSTDKLWEFWHAKHLADGWHADFGGAIENVSQSPGYYTTTSWAGADSNWGATATSLPVAGGLMTIAELQAGQINHALAISIPAGRAGYYSWPAQRTDGNSTDPQAIPEGARFRLDPSLDVNSLKLTSVGRMIARAAQQYGLVVRDQTGHAIDFYAEDPKSFGSNPYPTLFGGKYANEVLAGFPWDRLHLLKMSLTAVKQ
jgi:hypothetical protein